jgi:hypothetical protein
MTHYNSPKKIVRIRWKNCRLLGKVGNWAHVASSPPRPRQAPYLARKSYRDLRETRPMSDTGLPYSIGVEHVCHLTDTCHDADSPNVWQYRVTSSAPVRGFDFQDGGEKCTPVIHSLKVPGKPKIPKGASRMVKVIRNVVTHGCAGYGSLGETGEWRG